MSVINGVIPPQSFELVRDRLGEILTDEFDKQLQLTGDYDLDVDVWVERFIPFDKKELPAINVMVPIGDYDGETVKQADGTYTYFLDFHTRAKTNSDDRGDQKALHQLHRLIGIARAIIMNPQYRTLGFSGPFVKKRRVIGFEIANPDPNNADSVVMGRMKVEVKLPETTELIDAVTVGGGISELRLELTDKGYRYIFY